MIGRFLDHHPLMKMMLFGMGKRTPRKTVRVEHVTDGRNHWWARKCKTCGAHAVECKVIGSAVCVKCGQVYGVNL
jgi:hypothetical protein